MFVGACCADDLCDEGDESKTAEAVEERAERYKDRSQRQFTNLDNWYCSKKGNHWRKYNGTLVTIFWQNGGHCAIVDSRPKPYCTGPYQNEQDAMSAAWDFLHSQ